jgi:hypothetical protein
MFAGKAVAYPSDALPERTGHRQTLLLICSNFIDDNIGTRFSQKAVRFSWFYCHKKVKKRL